MDERKSLFYSLASKRICRTTLPERGDDLRIRVMWLRFVDQSAQPPNRKWNLKHHKHSFCELHLPLGGSVTYQFGQERFVVYENMMLFVSKGEGHQVIERTPDFKKLTFGFEILKPDGALSADQKQMYDILLHKPHVLCYDTGNLRKLLDEALSEAYWAKIGYREAVRSLVVRLVYEIARLIAPSARSLEKSEQSRNANSDPRVIEAERFVRDNVMLDIGGEQVATHIHISLRQLNRLFISERGVSVAAFISQCRCEAARELLAETEMSMRDICEEMNFSNEFNFIRFFKRYEGMPPGKFRALIRGTNVVK